MGRNAFKAYNLFVCGSLKLKNLTDIAVASDIGATYSKNVFRAGTKTFAHFFPGAIT